MNINKLIVGIIFLATFFLTSTNAKSANVWMNSYERIYTVGELKTQKKWAFHWRYSRGNYTSLPSYTYTLQCWNERGELTSITTSYNSFFISYSNIYAFDCNATFWYEDYRSTTMAIETDSNSANVLFTVMGQSYDYSGNSIGTFFGREKVYVGPYQQVSGHYVSGNYVGDIIYTK